MRKYAGAIGIVGFVGTGFCRVHAISGREDGSLDRISVVSFVGSRFGCKETERSTMLISSLPCRSVTADWSAVGEPCPGRARLDRLHSNLLMDRWLPMVAHGW